MSLDNLSSFITAIDRIGELHRITQPVKVHLELTEIADRVSKMPGGGQALLFEHPILRDGSRASMPVAINLFGSMRRMALALGGVGLAIGAPSEAGDPVGLGFAFAGVFIGAFASVFVKRLEVGAVALQAWAAVASLLVMLPGTLLLESGQIAAVEAAPLAVGACVLFAGVVVSVGAHSAYFRLFQAHDANLIVPMTLLTPLLTIAFGTWLTGDAIGWPLIIGGTMALAGVAIIVVRPSRTIFKWQLMRPKL